MKYSVGLVFSRARVRIVFYNMFYFKQCFHKTLGTRRRQWPPSKQEILCTINRRPIYARFHFMDGQFHAIEFDPSATAEEVLKLVKAKIGLREHAQGMYISIDLYKRFMPEFEINRF